MYAWRSHSTQTHYVEEMRNCRIHLIQRLVNGKSYTIRQKICIYTTGYSTVDTYHICREFNIIGFLLAIDYV